jgi:crossover junction endodeoxyribonuclease RuvC
VGITLQQFKQLEDRLGGQRPRKVFAAKPASNTGTHKVIIGIDPSLRGTGFGVIELRKPHAVATVHGTIRCPASWPRSRCLAGIAHKLRDVLREQQPTACVVEGIFYAQNLQTAIIMGEARGAALSVVAEAGLEIFEIATRKVKQSIVGYGAAQKFAVARMVQRMLHLTDVPEPDAADALALALAHAQENNRYSLTPPKRI